MKKLPRSLFAVLLAFLASCSIPAGLSEKASRPIDEHGVKGEIRTESFNDFKVGAEGSGHYVVVPTLKKEKGYNVFLDLEGRSPAHLRLRYTGQEAPDKAKLEEILDGFKVSVSPKKDCLAWWQEGEDEYLNIWHFTDQGSMFMAKPYHKLYKVGGEKPDWNSIASAREMIYAKIRDTGGKFNGTLDGANAHRNDDFWALVNEIEGDERLDEAVLEIWPKVYRAEEPIRKRCQPGAKVSDAWKKKALTKAWNFSGNSLATELIYAIGSQADIDKLDIVLLDKWPAKNQDLEARVAKNTPPLSPDFENKLKLKYHLQIESARILSSDDAPARNKKALILSKAAWMAEHFDDQSAFQSAIDLSIDAWPRSYYAGEFLFSHFPKASKLNQDKVLKKGAVAESDNKDVRDRIRKMMEKYGSCDQLKAIAQRDPSQVDPQLRRCREK